LFTSTSFFSLALYSPFLAGAPLHCTLYVYIPPVLVYIPPVLYGNVSGKPRREAALTMFACNGYEDNQLHKEWQGVSLNMAKSVKLLRDGSPF